MLGYADEPGRSGPWDGLVDPLGQGPAVWFQRMDAPRPQRNRIHVDVSVPHDEAEPRIQPPWRRAGRLSRSTTGPAVASRHGSRFLSQTRRPTAKTTAVGLQMSTVSSG